MNEMNPNTKILFTLQGENKCGTAEENGVSILHGNALAFVKVRPDM